MSEQSDQTNEVRIEGILRASRRDVSFKGKQFLGAAIEGNDGTRWIISYAEDSSLHRFADQHVVAYGEPYKPTGQHLIGRDGKLGHFRVSRIQLAERT